MKYLFTFFLSLIAFSFFAQDASVYFDSDQFQIREDQKSKLNEINQNFQINHQEILLVGHCDLEGSNDYNMDLSQKRVEQVRSYFLHKHIPFSSIKTDYKGEGQALAVDEKYRRVDIFLIQKPTLVTQPIIEKKIIINEVINVTPILPEKDLSLETDLSAPGPVPQKIGYEDYISSITPSPNSFIYSSKEDLIIEGKHGTLVYIPSDAFVYKNGDTVTGKVDITLTDYATKKEFFAQKLATISDGNLLISNGMILIEAKSNNKNLALQKGKEIEIAFPKTDETFYTFYGDTLSNGTMNWKIDESLIPRNNQTLDDLAVTLSEDGKTLELVDKKEAKKRNKDAKLKGMEGVLTEMTPEYLARQDSIKRASEADFKKIIDDRKKNWAKIKKQKDIINSKKLGFINCDRFMKDSSATIIEYLVQVDNSNESAITAFLILHKYNSALELGQQRSDIFYINARMPLGEKATIIVTGKNKKDEFFMYKEAINIAQKTNAVITLKKSSYKELDKVLTGL